MNGNSTQPLNHRRAANPCGLMLLFGALLPACGDPAGGGESVSVAESPLKGGTPTSARLQIGSTHYPGSDKPDCTATLVDPLYAITASHCVLYRSAPAPAGATFWMDTGETYVPLVRTYAFGADEGADDVAFARLETPITFVSPVLLSLSQPSVGSTVTVFGWGNCDPADETGKTFFQWSYGSPMRAGCEGDSGGPAVHGSVSQNGNIWGILSGNNFFGTGFADGVRHGLPGLRAVRAFGGSVVRNNVVSNFPAWAATVGVKAFSGDFNADGFGDVALLGGSGWTTIPVAFGGIDGRFNWQNEVVPNFPAWARQARSIVTGDFDDDGRTDIALVGLPGWTSIPIAKSIGSGSFSVVNVPSGMNGALNSLAMVTGAYAVAGNFDGGANGDDIALVGGAGWTTTPMGFSNRNGTFNHVNNPITDFQAWSRAAGARALVGDFDSDDDADIALTGVAGWTTLPVAYSARNGSFSVVNWSTSFFPQWASTPGVKLVAADFNGDTRTDIAAVGGNGWRTIAFALATSGGGFFPANFPMADVPAWGTHAKTVLAGNFNFDQRADLILVGGSGWNSIPVVQLAP